MESSDRLRGGRSFQDHATARSGDRQAWWDEKPFPRLPARGGSRLHPPAVDEDSQTSQPAKRSGAHLRMVWTMSRSDHPFSPPRVEGLHEIREREWHV